MMTSVRIRKGVQALVGTYDGNLKLLERCFQVSAHLGEETLEIEGEEANVRRAQRLVEEYSELVENGTRFESAEIEGFLRIMSQDPDATLKGLAEAGRPRTFGKKSIAPKSLNQRRYVDAIERHDMVFGIGPSGTGKTYLAVAMAVDALLTKEVSRIILARPAVEAGERLGFLPGTLQEKINPYLRPLYDALYDVLDPDRVERYLEKGIIEIAPIAFMRGRTLERRFRDSGRSAEHHQRADEDVPDAPGLQFQGRDHGRRHADRSSQRAALRAGRGGGRGGQGRRHQLHLFHRAGRGAAQPGATDHPRLRGVRSDASRQKQWRAEVR